MPISSKYTIAVILACLSSAPAFAQTDALVLSSATVSPGGSASLNLSLTSPGGSAPAALQWTFVYSPTNIVNIGAIAGAAATAAGKSLECAASSGSYTCLLTGITASGLDANIIQNGVVAVVTATISASTTTTSIGIANALGATQSGAADPIAATGGTITALPLGVASLSCNPGTVTSSASTTCTVGLNQVVVAGATVTLSDNNALLAIPSIVTVPAGASSVSFIGTAGVLPANQSATITATLNGTLQSITLTLVAQTLVSALACNPTSVNSGASTSCTVTLSQAAPSGGSTVALSSNNTALPVSASVTVPANSTSAAFSATVGAIATNQSATVTASLSGSSQTTTVNLVAPTLVSALACNPATLDAGASSTCTVTLSAPAPTGGVTVSIAANAAALTVPAALNVPAGSSTGTFTATATTEPEGGESTQTVLVTTTLNDASQSQLFTLIVCPCSLWPSTAQPLNPASTNKQAVEVGMQFTSNISGYVTGVRFFKGSANNGTHMGSLWTANGTRLAEVTFTGETKSGWQIAYFASPIFIPPNTIYVISYHAPQGHNAADNGAFTTAVNNLPLRALANGQNGPNGVYTYGSSAFPATGASATNYWVDVVFNTAPIVGTASPASVWAATAVPNTPAVASTQAAELGLTVMSSLPGYITGVRFYKGPKNLGTHIGYLWSSTGTMLASVTFTNESATGWQQANFSTPIAIDANTVYVFSYWSPKGHYADDAGYFATSGVTNQMLYAPPDGQYGPNGSYAASNAFPASSANSSNYWVDLVFTTAIQ